MKNVSELTANNLFNNCLYLYSGGGYDGCFCEPNVFLVNKDGKFFDIYSSGVFGIKVNDLSTDTIVEKYLNSTDTFIYELDNETEILEFTSEYYASFVLSVGDRVNKIYSDEYNEAPVVFKCPMCGEIESIYLETAYGVGLKCLGGITYSAEQIICEDCYSEHTCDYCGDFHSDINEFFYSEDYGNVCEYCYEEKTEEGKLAKERKEKEEIEKDSNEWESEEEKETAMNKLRELIARLDGE